VNPSSESSDNVGILLLCEVALGKAMELNRARPGITKPNDGFDSVHGMGKRAPLESGFASVAGGVTVPCGQLELVEQASQNSLEYNEFIVYNTAQQRPRFLVEMEFCSA